MHKCVHILINMSKMMRLNIFEKVIILGPTIYMICIKIVELVEF